jgi:hypothetical protein
MHENNLSCLSHILVIAECSIVTIVGNYQWPHHCFAKNVLPNSHEVFSRFGGYLPCIMNHHSTFPGRVWTAHRVMLRRAPGWERNTKTQIHRGTGWSEVCRLKSVSYGRQLRPRMLLYMWRCSPASLNATALATTTHRNT